MFEYLFGNKTAEKVLLYMQNYGEGHASEISATFSIPLNMIQKQLKRLEAGGILVSQPKGRTRLYLWNPRYFFKKELQSLLSKGLDSLGEEETRMYYRKRTRPRRSGKPL